MGVIGGKVATRVQQAVCSGADVGTGEEHPRAKG